MTYRELKRKYLLKEITEEEYEQGKEKIFERLFEMYEENIIDQTTLTNKIKMLK